MSILYNNIVRLCEKRGVSPSGMCVDLGLSKNVISRLKNNEEAQLSYATAKKIADYFKVDVDTILRGVNENEKSAAPDGAALHTNSNYDKLSDANKEIIDDLIAKLLKSQSDD